MSKPRASVVEIIASGRKPTEDGGGSIVVPNEVRINGVSVFTTGNGVKISEFTLGDETVSVNLTLVVRKLTIAAASDLETSEPSGESIAQVALRHLPPPYEYNGPERPIRSTCAVLHTDMEGRTIPCPDEQPDPLDALVRECRDTDDCCPGGPSACRLDAARAERAEEGHPEPPSEDELNPALPVHPDPRQPAYDAVYDYIRSLGGYLPPDTAHRNAVIWRAVNAALGATPVGRCVSSHCVEGDHTLPVESETP